MNPVKEIRAKLGISQYRLANLLKINRASVCRYEKGDRHPNYRVLMRLANLCKKHNINFDKYFGEQ